jgi:hypothetical protein
MGLDPVHNPRKVTPFAGYDKQVYVGGHDTEIGKPKTELFLCVLKDKQHDFSPHVALKNPFFVVGSGRNVIRRPFNEFPFFPHKISSTPIYGAEVSFCFDFGFKTVPGTIWPWHRSWAPAQ